MRRCWQHFLLTGIGILALCISAKGQKIVPEAGFFSVRNGLSQAQVNCIFQDSRGFLWIGTQDGLNRYDGNYFLHFQHQPFDTASISNNYIRSIAEDRDGNLWIGTDYGLNLFRRNTETFTCFSHHSNDTKSLAGNQVYAVFFDHSGVLWVKTAETLDRFDQATQTFMHYKHYWNPFNFVSGLQSYPILEDTHGNLWFGTKDGLGLLNRLTGKIDFFTSKPTLWGTLSHDFIRTIFQDKKGVLWIGTANGLDQFDYSEKTFKVFYPGNTSFSIPENSVNSIEEDNKGILWLGTNSGYVLFDPGKHTCQYFKEVQTNDRTQKISTVTSILRDHSGIMWIGSLEGLYKIDTKPSKFRLYRRSVTGYPNFSSNDIASIYEDRDGRIWIGTWGSGLNLFDRRTGNVIQYSQTNPDPARHISNDYVHVIFRDSGGKLIIGTQNGVDIMTTRNQFMPFCSMMAEAGCSIFKNNRVFSILEDQAGNLWFGTSFGLHRFNRNSKTFNSFYQIQQKNVILDINTVYSLVEDKKGNIWFGTDNGLNCFSTSTGLFRHYENSDNPADSSISSNSVYSLFVDSKDDLWAGTESGLNRYVAGQDRFVSYTVRNGLINSIIYAITEDTRGNIWISTNKGLVKFNPHRGAFVTFDPADGLQNYEFNIGSKFTSESGEIFFGGISGFNSFYPDSIRFNTYVAPVRITLVELVSPLGVTKTYYDIPQELVIPASVKIFHIDFSLLDFTNPSRNRFEYKIVRAGEEGDWIDLQNRYTASFANLPPGEYVFKVKGANPDMVWNEEGTSLKIYILAPIWKTKAAIVFYIVFSLSVIIFVFRYRTRNLRRTNKILTEKQIAALKIDMQRKELAIKNKNITDSLNYAKRIQEALMPSSRFFFKALPESFVFHKPRDIVSGDFYWINEKDGLICLAAVDCTGHGVPGAFMSIIGFELFRKVTHQGDLRNPADLLNQLNLGYAEIFEDMENISLKDGMDIALVTIDKIKKTLVFSGAFNPLFLVRDEKVTEIKGDRFSVGLDKERSSHEDFTNHEIDLRDNDVFYIFSDGFADQFGGKEGKKYKYRRFRYLLLNVHKLPMPEQKKRIEEAFENWKGTYDQVDDVMVIGFKPLGK